jgi:hypothetical protein
VLRELYAQHLRDRAITVPRPTPRPHLGYLSRSGEFFESPDARPVVHPALLPGIVGQSVEEGGLKCFDEERAVIGEMGGDVLEAAHLLFLS